MTDDLDQYKPGKDVTDEFRIAEEIGIVLSIRFSADEADSVIDAAEKRGQLLTEFAKQVILAATEKRQSGGLKHLRAKPRSVTNTGKSRPI